MKKIIIFGFPHSGTTILRTILSHIPEVYAHFLETQVITKHMITNANKDNKSVIVIKYPWMINVNKYKDYEKIFIIRNPMWVFSSLNIRFASRDKLPNHTNLETYHKMAQQFINTQGKNIKKLHHIRYEDMFDNNYKNLKTLFNNVGLKYSDDIFDNTKYLNINSNNKKMSDERKKEILQKTHEPFKKNYKTWQLNQEFKNMNYPEKVKLKKNQIIFLQEKIGKLNIYNFK